MEIEDIKIGFVPWKWEAPARVALVFPVNAEEYNVRREHGRMLRHGQAALGRIAMRSKYSDYLCNQQGITEADPNSDFQDGA